MCRPGVARPPVALPICSLAAWAILLSVAETMPELAAEAMIPNPRLAALAPLIGAWTLRLTVSADGNSIHGAGEMSRDGATWEPDLELTYTRAK